jgi:orotate phosphoribosyltransferase
MTSSELEELKKMIVSRAVEIRETAFTLASGKTSNVYIDLRRLTQDPKGINLIGGLVLQKIEELSPEARFVGGLETSAIPISTAVALLSLKGGKGLRAFWVRKKQKDHGMQNTIEGNLEKGAKVVIVDDTVTTGGSSLQAADAVREFGARVVQAIAIVDRGAKENFAKVRIPYFTFFRDTELVPSGILTRAKETSK